MTIKLGSLFDGSGGFPLAGALCGIEPIWAAEVEPYPIAVTTSRFPNMKHLGDVSKINGAEIEPVDIITFGSPCQDLSTAGLRKGLKHEVNGDEETTRSGLFMEAVRIIKEMRAATNGEFPKVCLWENVPGAFSSNSGNDFRVVCEELIKIVEPDAVMPDVPPKGWPYADSYSGNGFSLAYRVFDAQYWGVPQRRRRIHLVIDFTSGTGAREILFELQGLYGNPPSSRAPWQAIAPDAEGGALADDREGGSTGGRLDALAYTMVVRSGVEVDAKGKAAGKGALIQTERASTLNTVQDQYLFQPAAFSFDPLSSNSMKSKNPHSGCREVEVARTIDTTDPNPSKNQGGLAIVQPAVFRKGTRPHNTEEAQTWEDADVAHTLNAFDMKWAQTPELVVEPIPIHDQATRFSGKRGDKQDGKGNGLGVGACGDPMNTLTGGDRHCVAYGIDQGATRDVGKLFLEETSKTLANGTCPGHHQGVVLAYGVDCRNFVENPETYPTMQAKPNGGQSLNYSGAVRVQYIVRRLTPTECARLQGFADWWGHIEPKHSLTDEEHRFWMDVRNTHAAINGKAVKDYNKTQMLNWYNKLWTDGAEYKMWGNGIALPPALFCMANIAEVLNREEDDSWLM